MINNFDKIKKFRGVFKEPLKVTPTNGEPDGPICGNGDLGVVLGGVSGNMRLWIGKNDMWRTKPHQLGGGMMAALLLDIRIQDLVEGVFYAEQRIEAGEIFTDTQKDNYRIQTNTYASTEENIVITKITCIGDDVTIQIEPSAMTGVGATCSAQLKGNKTIVQKSYEGNDLLWDVHLYAVFRVLEKDEMDFTLKTGESVHIICVAATNFDDNDFQTYAERLADHFNAEKLENDCKSQKLWWQHFWD